MTMIQMNRVIMTAAAAAAVAVATDQAGHHHQRLCLKDCHRCCSWMMKNTFGGL